MSALARLLPRGHLLRLLLIISPRTLLRWQADLVRRRRGVLVGPPLQPQRRIPAASLARR